MSYEYDIVDAFAYIMEKREMAYFAKMFKSGARLSVSGQLVLPGFEIMILLTCPSLKNVEII